MKLVHIGLLHRRWTTAKALLETNLRTSIYGIITVNWTRKRLTLTVAVQREVTPFDIYEKQHDCFSQKCIWPKFICFLCTGVSNISFLYFLSVWNFHKCNLIFCKPNMYSMATPGKRRMRRWLPRHWRIWKLYSEIMETTWNVKVKAVLFNLEQYVQQIFAFFCSLWNDRDFTRSHSYGQRIRQIRIAWRTDPEDRNEGCASGDT